MDFPVWTRDGRGGQGPREDEVPATEQTLLPNLKILISVVVRSHSSSIWRTCVGGMGRVGIPTKSIFPRGLARGMVVDYGVLAEGEKTKRKKRKGEGQGMYTNIYRREVLPGRRPSARVVVDVDVHIFNIKNRVERGVELKFSPVGC